MVIGHTMGHHPWQDAALMKWPKPNRSWTPGVVFWVLFLGSIAFGKRYAWLDTVWLAALLLFLLVVSVYAVVQIFRKRQETDGYVGYRGVPRWVVRLFGDEVDSPRNPVEKH